MAEPTLEAQIEAARAYEGLMVPSLLGEWAPTVADAAGIEPGDRVLDVACGTGVLAREVASRTGSAERVTGLDPSAGMLEVAGQLAPAIDWKRGTAERMPFADGSFDAVVSQFGLMFFDDPGEALREALRVLRPDGRLAFAVWDSLDNNPAYADEVALLEREAGTQAAEPVRMPFVLGDRDKLTALFAEAGVRGVQATTHTGTASFPSVRVMVEADLRGWLPAMGVVLTEEEIARMLDAAEDVLSDYTSGDGTAVFQTSAHLVTGAK